MVVNDRSCGFRTGTVVLTGAELIPLILAVVIKETEPLSRSAWVMVYAEVQVRDSFGSREASRLPAVLIPGQVAAAPVTVTAPVTPAVPVFLTSCLKLMICPTVLYETDASACVVSWMITSWVLGVPKGRTDALADSSVAGVVRLHETRIRPMTIKRASG